MQALILASAMCTFQQLSIEQSEKYAKEIKALLESNDGIKVIDEFKEEKVFGSWTYAPAGTESYLAKNSDIKTTYKISHLDHKNNQTLSHIEIQSEWVEGEYTIQQNAHIALTWEKLEPIWSNAKVKSAEQWKGKKLFTDNTLNYFKTTNNITSYLNLSLDDWQTRIPANLGFSTKSHQGLAIGDINGDYLEDIFLSQPGGLPNLLLIRQEDGTFTENSKEAGLDHLESSRSALFVDWDNDRDLDLAVAFSGTLTFFSNNGRGKFNLESQYTFPEITSLAAADITGDGLVDLYACRYLNPYENQTIPIPYHDANNGIENLFLVNKGGFSFEDNTKEFGFNENNKKFSFAASWEDYDNDGDLDLYVANDYGRNNLYENIDKKFKDSASKSNTEDMAAGMGVDWADIDNDGLLDLYVSNMFSYAGSRIIHQEQKEGDSEILLSLKNHIQGNSLLHNQGDGTFVDISNKSGTNMGRWSWGAIFCDFNNDSLPDIFVPNGFMTRTREEDL